MEEFKQKLEELKNKFQGRITQDSSADDIADVKATTDNLDELNGLYTNLEVENRKLKDVVAKMVLSQGDSSTPNDSSDPNEGQGLSIQQIIDEKLKNK